MRMYKMMVLQGLLTRVSLFIKRELPECSHQGDEVSIAKAMVFEAHPRDSASFPPSASSAVFRSHSGKLSYASSIYTI